MNLLKVTFKIRALTLRLLPLIILCTLFDFLGTALILPFISIIGNMDTNDHQIVQYLYILLSMLGLPSNSSALVGYIILIFILKAIIQVMYRWLASRGALQWMVDLRSQIFVNIYNSRFSMINEDRSRLINSLTTQSELAFGAIYQSFQLWQSIFVIISTIILANILSWKLFAVLIVFGSILSLLIRITTNLSLRYGNQLAELNKTLFSIAGQAINSYRYLKSTFSHGRLYSDFTPVIQKLKNIQVKFTVLNAITSSLTEPITIFIIALLFVVGNLIEVSSSLLVMQSIVMYRLFSRIMPLAAELQGFNKSYASLNYIDEVLNELNNNHENNGNHLLENKINEIVFSDVTFKYAKDVVLDKINIKFYHPSLTTILGESGSGKTTMLNLLTGLLFSSEGFIKINNNNIQDLNIDTYRSKIGLLNQEPLLFNMSIRENLRFRNNSIDDNELIEWIEKFKLTLLFKNGKIDLDMEINELSSNLSGGQKQRLCFIREIVSNPEIFILDEPTSALDEKSKAVILNMLNKLKKEMIIILVSHDHELIKASDSIYNMIDGKLLKK